MVKNVVHLSKTAKTTTETLNLVDYIRSVFAHSTPTECTKTIANIPRIMKRKHVHRDHVGNISKLLRLRTEQNKLSVLMPLVEKYVKPGEIIYDPFTGSYANGCT